MNATKSPRVSILVLIVAVLGFTLPLQGQEEQKDNSKEDMMKKLEEVLDEGSSPSTGDEKKVEKANRSLHGGSEGPSGRQKKNPVKILNEIIDEMDQAARSLESNTREMNRVKTLLKKLQKEATGAEQQKEIRKKIKKIFEKSKEHQKSATGELKEIASLKKKFQSAKSSQKKSMMNLEQLIRMASKKSSSSGQGKKKKKKRKSGKKRKKSKQKKQSNNPNKNKPADKPYEASSREPENLKVHEGKASDWGNLPPKVREAIIQRRSEEYVPGYAERLRNYYKKLGEETDEE